MVLLAATLQRQHDDFEKLNRLEENKRGYDVIYSVVMTIPSEMLVDA